MRIPAVAGSFYPKDPKKLESSISGFLNSVNPSKRKCIGIVAPHAGYEYCGRTAASVYKSMADGFDTAVIIGPNHTGLGVGVSVTSQVWKTPLGNVNPDLEFIDLLKGKLIMDDPMSHIREHSIEVQLPWLQHLFGNAKIVPISLNPIYYDIKTATEIGTAIARTIKSLDRNVIIIASSDFTHYGSAYSNDPYLSDTDSNVLRKVNETDMEAIKLITSLKPDEFIRLCDEKRLTICGYGGIAAMLHAAKLLGAKDGKLIDYSTSYDVSKDINAVVGYAGIAVF